MLQGLNRDEQRSNEVSRCFPVCYTQHHLLPYYRLSSHADDRSDMVTITFSGAKFSQPNLPSLYTCYFLLSQINWIGLDYNSQYNTSCPQNVICNA